MSIGVAFATSVFRTYNDRVRAEAQAVRDRELKDAEKENQKELYQYQSDLISDRTKKEYDMKADERAANQYLQFWDSYPDEMKLTLLQDDKFRTNHFEITGQNISAEHVKTAAAMDDAATFQTIGGVKFKGYDTKGTESQFNRAKNDIEHLNTLLQDPEFFVKVKTAIEGTGRDEWFNYLTRLENTAMVAFDADQAQKRAEGYEPRKFSFDITEYQFIGKLAPLFGGDLEAKHDEAEKTAAQGAMPPNREPVMFEVELLEQGSMKVAMPFSSDDKKIIDEIAAGMNMSTSQFIVSFNDLRNIPPQDEMESIYTKKDGTKMSPEEIARQQYGLLKDVIDLKKRGFGNLDLLAQSPQKRQELRNILQKKYGKEDGGIDRYKAAMVLGYLTPTPDYFTIPPQSYTFGGQDKVPAAPTASGREFLMQEIGMSEQKIEERLAAAKYSRDTIFFMDRLYELETKELDEAGLARWIKKTLGGGIKQIPQVIGAFKDIFSGDKGADVKIPAETQLVGNYKNNDDGTATTQESLMDVVRRNAGDLGIDLANITEAEALKITLAARMARALDPAGRLSNQDFEVQLQRLGNSMLGTPETVARNLQRLAREFQREVQHHVVFAEVAAPGSKITPRKARLLMADQKIGTLMEYDTSITGNDGGSTTADAPVVPPQEETSQGLGEPITITGRSQVSQTRAYQQGDKTYPVTMYEKDGKPAYAVEIDGKLYPVDKNSLVPVKPQK